MANVLTVDGTLIVTGLSLAVVIAGAKLNNGVATLVETGFSDRVAGDTIGVVINGEAVELVVGIGLSFVVNIGDIVGVTPNDTLVDVEGTPKDRLVEGKIVPNGGLVAVEGVILV